MSGRPRHVALNAVFLRPWMGGMVSYVRSLVPELAAERPGTRLTLLVAAGVRDELAGEPWAAGVDVVSHASLGVPGLTLASEMTVVPQLAARRGAAVLHSLAMTGPLRSRLPHVVTVPDLIWWHRPESSGRLTTALWRLVVPPTARHADRVVTISEASKRDVVQMLGVPAERVDVTLCGPGDEREVVPVPEAELRSTLGLGDGRIVLCLSAHRPHKNLLALVEAMGSISAALTDVILVLGGRHTEHTEELRAAARRLGVRLATPGWLEDEQVEGLYRAAVVFVYPSLIEGFGLPVLEAMRRGVPVACSSVSAVGEVAGAAAATFDPHEPDDIVAAVSGVLRDADRARALQAAGRARAATFTWRRTAQGTWEAYDRALAARAGRANRTSARPKAA